MNLNALPPVETDGAAAARVIADADHNVTKFTDDVDQLRAALATIDTDDRYTEEYREQLREPLRAEIRGRINQVSTITADLERARTLAERHLGSLRNPQDPGAASALAAAQPRARDAIATLGPAEAAEMFASSGDAWALRAMRAEIPLYVHRSLKDEPATTRAHHIAALSGAVDRALLPYANEDEAASIRTAEHVDTVAARLTAASEYAFTPTSHSLIRLAYANGEGRA